MRPGLVPSSSRRAARQTATVVFPLPGAAASSAMPLAKDTAWRCSAFRRTPFSRSRRAKNASSTRSPPFLLFI